MGLPPDPWDPTPYRGSPPESVRDGHAHWHTERVRGNCHHWYWTQSGNQRCIRRCRRCEGHQSCSMSANLQVNGVPNTLQNTNVQRYPVNSEIRVTQGRLDQQALPLLRNLIVQSQLRFSDVGVQGQSDPRFRNDHNEWKQIYTVHGELNEHLSKRGTF